MTIRLRQDPLGRFAVAYEQGVARTPLMPDTQATSPKGSEPTTACPFCPGNEQYCRFSIDQTMEGENWQLRVIPNRLPVFSIEGSREALPDGIYDVIGGPGAHEVLIETPQHALQPFDFGQVHWQAIFAMVLNRLLDLKQDIRFPYISFYRNHGLAGGAPLGHPHSQILALPFVPPEVTRKLEALERHQHHKGRCLLCDMVHHETSARKRVLAENEAFVAIAPYASRYPFEMHILPRRHQMAFEDMSREELTLFSQMFSDCLQKLQRALAEPPFHVVLSNCPNSQKKGDFHWHMEIIPRIFAATALQEGSGIFLNPIAPEEAVKLVGNRPAQGFDDFADENGMA